jgi:hypothetical protein
LYDWVNRGRRLADLTRRTGTYVREDLVADL